MPSPSEPFSHKNIDLNELVFNNQLEKGYWECFWDFGQQISFYDDRKVCGILIPHYIANMFVFVMTERCEGYNHTN